MSEEMEKLYQKVERLFRDKKLDEAITVLTEMIGLTKNPEKQVPLYNDLGNAFLMAKDFDSAFRSFLEANKRDKNLKSWSPLVYITSQLTNLSSDGPAVGKFFELFIELLLEVEEIKNELFCKPPEDGVAHYTSLHALIFLSDNSPFRLYNVAYMNDPEEGIVFFEIMKDKIDLKKTFYKNDLVNFDYSPAYIGSFVKVNSHERREKDKLFLWRTYGKHDNEEAAGACLVFNKEQFAKKNPPPKIGSMFQLMGRVEQRDITASIYKHVLYKVIYKNEIENTLSEKLNRLAELLNKMDETIKDYSDDKEKLADLVREILDSVRFLFKADHYREENEVRVVEMLYAVDGEQNSQREIDMCRIPPRFYFELFGDIKFSEVILGPNTNNVPEWQQWLREKNIEKVNQSKIKYKGNS